MPLYRESQTLQDAPQLEVRLSTVNRVDDPVDLPKVPPAGQTSGDAGQGREHAFTAAVDLGKLGKEVPAADSEPTQHVRRACPNHKSFVTEHQFVKMLVR